MNLKSIALLSASLAAVVSVRAGETNDKLIAAPAEEGWQFKLSLPALVPWLTGDTAINGKGTHLDLAANDIIPRIDMVADVRAEAHKGRFSLTGELLYMSLSDGVGTSGVVKKLDLQVDQTMAELGAAWRIIDTPRGWLEVIGGVRYNNYYQKMALQPNDQRIDGLSGKLAVAGTAIRAASFLSILRDKNPTVPIAPLDADAIGRIGRGVAHASGTTAERKEKIAELLHHELSRTISRVDDWWDPYIGLRGRYNLKDKWYLSAKADFGGFTVGSDLSWTAEAALGFQLSPRIFNELGYRAIGVDYNQGGLTLRTVTHGPQLTLGIMF